MSDFLQWPTNPLRKDISHTLPAFFPHMQEMQCVFPVCNGGDGITMQLGIPLKITCESLRKPSQKPRADLLGMALVTRDHYPALPGLQVKGFCYILTAENYGLSWAPVRSFRHPSNHPPVAHYPPLSSLSSLHLLVKEFLVLE